MGQASDTTLQEAMTAMGILGEEWLEALAAGRPLDLIEHRIALLVKAYRKLEKIERKAAKNQSYSYKIEPRGVDQGDDSGNSQSKTSTPRTFSIPGRGPHMSHPSWTNAVLAFDVETTGSDPENDRIIQASAAIIREEEGTFSTQAFEWLINPGIPINPEATAVHGFTDAKVIAKGEEPWKAIAEIIKLIEERPAGVPLVAFNARFDLTVIDREARRHGYTPLTSRDQPVLVVDPLVIDKHIDKYRKGSRKLDAVTAHYGVDLDGAHDATNDAVAAGLLAIAMGRHGKVIRRATYPDQKAELRFLTQQWEQGRVNLESLHELQKDWALEQAISLQAYFRKTDPDAVVPSQWPLLEPQVAAA